MDQDQEAAVAIRFSLFSAKKKRNPTDDLIALRQHCFPALMYIGKPLGIPTCVFYLHWDHGKYSYLSERFCVTAPFKFDFLLLFEFSNFIYYP